MWLKGYHTWSGDLGLQIWAQRFLLPESLKAFPVRLGSLWTRFQKTLPWKRDGKKCEAEEDRLLSAGKLTKRGTKWHHGSTHSHFSDLEKKHQPKGYESKRGLQVLGLTT